MILAFTKDEGTVAKAHRAGTKAQVLEFKLRFQVSECSEASSSVTWAFAFHLTSEQLKFDSQGLTRRIYS